MVPGNKEFRFWLERWIGKEGNHHTALTLMGGLYSPIFRIGFRQDSIRQGLREISWRSDF